jgi:hypothetical protein
MDAQKDILKELMFGHFPGSLARILYPRRKPEDITYVEAAYKVKEPNRILPNDKRGSFEHDVILLFQHVIKNGTKVLFKDVVSIEIKTTTGDLLKSEVRQYLGATRLFFIAASGGLLPAIISKLHWDPMKQVIGVVDSGTGQIVVLPQFQNNRKDRRDRLLAQCYLSKHRLPAFNDQELFSIHRVRYPRGEEPAWVCKDGLRLNPDYLDLYAGEAEAGFDLNRYRYGE